jgi:hypothetical protein
MKKLLALLAFALLPLLAQAQILKCVGAGGRVEFAATCPPGTKAETTGIRNNPGAAPASQQKTLAERDADYRKRQLEQQESAKKDGEKSRESADRSANCENARSYLSSLEGGMRIRRTDPKTGEFVYLQDSERSAEIERAKQTVETNCK